MDDALTYVQMIISDADIDYWVVTLNGTNQPVGIITFIKREYLDHPDIGFAFLPDHSGFGYAREATEEVLDDLHRDHPVILATTMPANIKSIKLLDKLGFSKIQEMVRDTESFLVFKKDAGF